MAASFGLKFLYIERSIELSAGPIRIFFPVLPNWPTGIWATIVSDNMCAIGQALSYKAAAYR